MRSTIILTGLSFALGVAAHGTVPECHINGVQYDGVISNIADGQDTSKIIGWITPNYYDHGFISPHDYGNPNIICHMNAIASPSHATITAGDEIELDWKSPEPSFQGWDPSHKGPVMTYMAECSGNCENATKTELKWFKIAESGLVPGPLNEYGFARFASDDLIDMQGKWKVKIPEKIRSGNYVLRTEIIALHMIPNPSGGNNPDAAQHYPQCFSLEVVGGGTLAPAGVLGTSLYHVDEPGVNFNLVTQKSNYSIPGPPMFDGSSASDAVNGTAATATGTTAAVTTSSTPTTTTAATATAASTTSSTSANTSADLDGTCDSLPPETVTQVDVVTVTVAQGASSTGGPNPY